MLLCRGQLISGTALHMWERQTLNQELDLIPPDAVLVPPDERGLIDVKEDHVSPLQQLLACSAAEPSHCCTQPAPTSTWKCTLAGHDEKSPSFPVLSCHTVKYRWLLPADLRLVMMKAVPLEHEIFDDISSSHQLMRG